MVGGWTRLSINRLAREGPFRSSGAELTPAARRRRAVLTGIALVCGLAVAGREFVGGAHPLRVLTTFIVVAGALFYAFERLKRIIHAGTALSVLALLAVIGRQIQLSWSAGAWIPYSLAGVAIDLGFDGAADVAWQSWLLSQPAGIVTAAAVAAFAVAGSVVFPRRR